MKGPTDRLVWVPRDRATGRPGFFIKTDHIDPPEFDCERCLHMRIHRGDGHCYMFRDAPGAVCAKFTPDEDDRSGAG